MKKMTNEDKEKQERLEAHAGYILIATAKLVDKIVENEDHSAMLQLVAGFRELVSSLGNFNINPN